MKSWPTGSDGSPNTGFEWEIERNLREKLWPGDDEPRVALFDLIQMHNAIASFPISQRCIDDMQSAILDYANAYYGYNWVTADGRLNEKGSL